MQRSAHVGRDAINLGSDPTDCLVKNVRVQKSDRGWPTSTSKGQITEPKGLSGTDGKTIVLV